MTASPKNDLALGLTPLKQTPFRLPNYPSLTREIGDSAVVASPNHYPRVARALQGGDVSEPPTRV